jgi:hypothetical protein
MDDLKAIDQESYALGQIFIINVLIRTLQSELARIEAGRE